ncbi:LuxR C-terminal-related transcriptional regulator [Terrabacter sp. BE26]|uniref:helix-turn-helix transcriptional regulator n=1 Tax=Terrabacter sp. BE26 TaxID=2898152 RepID=UPI0035BE1812
MGWTQPPRRSSRLPSKVLPTVRAKHEHSGSELADGHETGDVAATLHGRLRAAAVTSGTVFLAVDVRHGTSHATAVTQILGRSTGQPRDGTSRSQQLTQREHEVLRYLATNFTAAEIAEAEYISLLTAKTHRAQLPEARRRQPSGCHPTCRGPGGVLAAPGGR